MISILEVKTKSPFGYQSKSSFEEQLIFCQQHADWVSVHTNEQFGGSWSMLEESAKRTQKPIVAKGFHPSKKDVSRALNLGADYVLTVGWLPEQRDVTLVEPRSYRQFLRWNKAGRLTNRKVVWNARDLRTGGCKEANIEAVQSVYSGWLCQASTIKTADDVRDGVEAALVGSNKQSYIRTSKKQDGSV